MNISRDFNYLSMDDDDNDHISESKETYLFKNKMRKGIIYCIKSLNSNLIYIGSTKQSLATRKAKHIYDSKKEHRIKPVHRIINAYGGFQNFQMKLLKEVDDISMLHLVENKKLMIYKNNDDYKLMNTYN